MPAPETPVNIEKDMLSGCGGEIHFIGQSMEDSRGHQVFLAHSRAVDELLARNRELAASLGRIWLIHIPDPEGIIPICHHCRRPYPCPTVVAVKGDGTRV